MPVEELLAKVGSTVTYLLPGFVAYAMIYRTMVPVRRESDLVITTKSLMWSLAIDACFMWWAGPAGVDWHAPQTIAKSLLCGVATGIAGGLLVRWRVLTWAWGLLKVDYWPGDKWSQFLVDKHFVFVHLKDGRTYVGWPERYSDDPSARDQELVLIETWVFPKDSKEPIQLDRPVYIPLSAISSIDKGPPSLEPSGECGSSGPLDGGAGG